MAENPILNNRYRLIEQIGSGGMAVIYKAQDMELGRLVTIKVLRPSLVSDPEFLMRFKREAQAAANLSHPNIVIVYDVGQDGPKTHYIVMEYVPGQDLKKLIRARGSFSVDEALAIIIEVCKGVGYAHRAGLVHCDVKPQNILVTPDNRIKVTDFGIARALTGAAPQVEDMVWGSPHYFSPEQAAGETPTPASDVYSIGVVLFELLTGRLPFTGSDYQELAMAHLKEQPPSILDLNPALPPELDKIIRKVMSKEPSARYRTADQLGRILEKYMEEGQQQTAAFVVNPSAVDMDAQPTYAHSPASQPIAEPTLPALPPVEINENRPYARRVLQQPYDEPSSDYYPAPSQSFLPGVDLYGIALGILAAIALLGLIPLWFAVYRVLTHQ